MNNQPDPSSAATPLTDAFTASVTAANARGRYSKMTEDAIVRADHAEAACAAMRAAINMKIDDMEPYEYCHKEARWVTEKHALRDYFRNLFASAETTAGEALLKDKARLDWLEAHRKIVFCLSWNDLDKWTLCNNPTNTSGGANIIAEGPDLRRCLDAAAETQP